jgi:SagB-type dehydrogenase family enzyme
LSCSFFSSPAVLLARLTPGVELKVGADGQLAAFFDDNSVPFDASGAAAARAAAALVEGLPLAPSEPGDAAARNEVEKLVRRLSIHGLVEYRLARDGVDIVVVEPQMRDYAPRFAPVDEMRPLALSRFAYLRRRGADMVIESPRAGALFRLCDAEVAALIAGLAAPRTFGELVTAPGWRGVELLSLLIACDILFAPGSSDRGLRAAEGDADLVLWDFHDLLFHARSTFGRHANPTGGRYAFADIMEPLPAVRPSWPGEAIMLAPFGAPPEKPATPFAQLLLKRHSTRSFDADYPITLRELAWLLGAAARIVTVRRVYEDDDEQFWTDIAVRPYPSGGASYELELYLAVDTCEGLGRGFYHYDSDRHALVLIPTAEHHLRAMLGGAQAATGAKAPPQILLTMAARFGRVSWKYSGFAYQLVLKDVGVLMQTLYLMATDLDLGSCAIGACDIDLFARMTGIAFHIEGAVGQMMVGHASEDDGAD